MENKTSEFRLRLDQLRLNRFYRLDVNHFVFCGETCLSSFASGFMIFLHSCLLVSSFQEFRY